MRRVQVERAIWTHHSWVDRGSQEHLEPFGERPRLPATNPSGCRRHPAAAGIAPAQPSGHVYACQPDHRLAELHERKSRVQRLRRESRGQPDLNFNTLQAHSSRAPQPPGALAVQVRSGQVELGAGAGAGARCWGWSKRVGLCPAVPWGGPSGAPGTAVSSSTPRAAAPTPSQPAPPWTPWPASSSPPQCRKPRGRTAPCMVIIRNFKKQGAISRLSTSFERPH